MNSQEYEQKRRACWEEFKKQNLDGEVQWQPVSRHDVYCGAFDRAFALGKQEKDAKPNNTIKARRKSDGEIIEVKEWRGASDVIYSSPDMNRFYQAPDLDFNVDAEETVIQGWVARDKDGDMFLYHNMPDRYEITWEGYIMHSLTSTSFLDLTWESEPEPVEVIIKRKKNG